MTFPLTLPQVIDLRMDHRFARLDEQLNRLTPGIRPARRLALVAQVQADDKLDALNIDVISSPPKSCFQRGRKGGRKEATIG